MAFTYACGRGFDGPRSRLPLNPFIGMRPALEHPTLVFPSARYGMLSRPYRFERPAPRTVEPVQESELRVEFHSIQDHRQSFVPQNSQNETCTLHEVIGEYVIEKGLASRDRLPSHT